MVKDVLAKFAKNLKKIRKQKGLSQEALALLCDIDRTYIGRIENLKRNPSLEVLAKLAKGLDIELSELLDI
jgi:transcriptional regulator with XRE-family HTH domain